MNSNRNLQMTCESVGFVVGTGAEGTGCQHPPVFMRVITLAEKGEQSAPIAGMNRLNA